MHGLLLEWGGGTGLPEAGIPPGCEGKPAAADHNEVQEIPSRLEEGAEAEADPRDDHLDGEDAGEDLRRFQAGTPVS